MTIAGLAVVGRVTSDVLILSVAALPAVAGGAALGRWLRPRVAAERFRSLVLAMLLLTSALALITAVAA